MPVQLPDTKGEWVVLRELIGLIDDGHHRTANGLDRILELKGLI